MARLGFVTNDYTEEFGGDFEPLPAGEYELMGIQAEEKDTKNKDGKYISTRFEVLGPTHAKRLIFVNFNIINKSDKAESIGRSQLASWARAVGKPNAQDTDELLNLPFIGKVGIEGGTGEYKDKNKIEGYKAKLTSSSSRGRPPGSSNKAKDKAAEPSPTPDTPKAAAAPSAPATSGRKAPWDE